MTPKGYISHFKTAGSLAGIEKWLNANVRGKWAFKLNGVSDDLVQKSYSLTFADSSDRERFRTRFTPAIAAKPI